MALNLVRYFAYGSNLDVEQMRERCPSARPLFRARLPDHRLDFTYLSHRWAGGAADVVPHFGDSVWGVVYELSVADLPRLDRQEGGYQRVILGIEDDRGQPMHVFSYRVVRKLSFRPTPVYLEKLISWGEHWNLPLDYVARLRRIPVESQP